MPPPLPSDATAPGGKPVGPDPLELYRWAVQDPLAQARVLQLIYARTFPGRVPIWLREDFAGTAMDSVAWVAMSEGRRALAVEIDAATLEWARTRARSLLGAHAQRLTFVQGDVRHVGPPAVPAAHVVAALNYSMMTLGERPVLREYFAHTLRSLHENGVFVANVFGGPECMRAHVRTTTVAGRRGLPGEVQPPPFEYQWEQHAFDARSMEVECRIHFERCGACGDAVRDAFRYRFRLWTLPELVEIAQEAGFRDVQVWQHTQDSEARVFLGPVGTIVPEDRWTAYLVAAK